MAAYATARPTLSFHLRTAPSPPHTKPTRTHLPDPFTNPRKPIISSPNRPPPHHFAAALSSVDVSKEDKPLSEQDPPPTPPPQSPSPPIPADETDSHAAAAGALPEEEREKEKFDRRRLEEQFVVLNTGVYECGSCGYLYDEAAGDPTYPIPSGLVFGKLPEDWRCPTCGAAKSFFRSKSVEIAGFAQNQQFGFGGNTLTSGQKALLIYGSLFFIFVLFLSGYFLQ